MHDWQQIVGARLQSFSLPAGNREEIILELAAHLEEVYETARWQGLNETEAFHRALQEAGNWSALSENLRHAALTKEQLMNHRAKSLWLPALASFSAASLFLLVLTRISLEPRFLVRLNSGLGWSFYLGWLVAQSLCGALGAFLARRGGGTRSTRVIAGIFPAIVMFGLWAFWIPTSAVMEHNAFVLRHPLFYALGIFVWVVPPGVASLLGAAPFLKEQELSEA